MQRKLYTEFDLLFDFISATVFGRGNIVLSFHIFFNLGWVTSSALVHLGYISYPFSCNVINVINSIHSLLQNWNIHND